MSDGHKFDFPFVSIVIPAKNEERDFGKCLTSLKALDYPPERLEIILVDNGSTDQTREIAQSHGVRVLREDSGTIARLRNIGVEASSGEILGFLDADMEVRPNWLKAALEVLESKEVGAVGGLLLIPDDATWVEKVWSLKRSSRPFRGPVEWLGSGNLVMPKNVFEQVGRWNEALPTCEDLDLCSRIKKKYTLIHYELVASIHHGGAKTLSEVFKKEIWRGSNNFDNVKTRIRNMREWPTLLFPLVHGCFLGVFLGAIFWNWRVALMVLPGTLLFPAMRAGYVAVGARKPEYFFQLLCVWFVYYSARSIAPFFRKSG